MNKREEESITEQDTLAQAIESEFHEARKTQKDCFNLKDSKSFNYWNGAADAYKVCLSLIKLYQT